MPGYDRHKGDQTVDLAAYVVTCPERGEILARTLAGLGASDWDAEPILIVDDNPRAVTPIARINTTWLKALERVAAGSAPVALVIEDDVEVNVHVRHNLQRWAPLAAAGIAPFCGTLYNAAQTTNPHAMWGSQGLVISRAVAAFVLRHWKEEANLSDTRIPRLASRVTTVHVHAPSLVQHVGTASTWGAPFHQAPDFDPSWRAP